MHFPTTRRPRNLRLHAARVTGLDGVILLIYGTIFARFMINTHIACKHVAVLSSF
jgi:hypothetical protein